MSNTLYLLVLSLLFLSCENKQVKLEQLRRHDDLIYFNYSRVAELGDEKWHELEPKVNAKIKIQYIDDIILASQFLDVNACASYVGDIEIKKDSIYLIYKLLPGDLCNSKAIDKATYIIKNPKIKKYKMSIRYE